MEFFQNGRVTDMKAGIGGFAQGQLEFHEAVRMIYEGVCVV
jgi:hypothetical protein